VFREAFPTLCIRNQTSSVSTEGGQLLNEVIWGWRLVIIDRFPATCQFHHSLPSRVSRTGPLAKSRQVQPRIPCREHAIRVVCPVKSSFNRVPERVFGVFDLIFVERLEFEIASACDSQQLMRPNIILRFGAKRAVYTCDLLPRALKGTVTTTCHFPTVFTWREHWRRLGGASSSPQNEIQGCLTS
jgi:hypothetical protein